MALFPIIPSVKLLCFKRDRRNLISCYSLNLYPVFCSSKKKTKHITLHIILICVKYNTVASPTLLRLIVKSSSKLRLFLPPAYNQGYLIFLPQFPCPYLFLQEGGGDGGMRICGDERLQDRYVTSSEGAW